ncbi:peptide-methionine (R)-S-oxide reductase [Mesobaculum littorinae]|uniref:peptide-methionine (R)-S-oxide reductase n=1 Tax=Mesobaculum littorinae TaxID=2486419 RepID=A0A438AJ02_9RHOB|nr:peptide-methionine (R)-S-oxide reductase MsrB [Mesobaculum littorinae]RVV98636.1 peptide-methionine (R)-S-oxide reductase [Mesobaculum littorinae]
MNRRDFTMASLAAFMSPLAARAATEGNFEVTRTEAEWKEMLSDLEYDVMREEGTERAFTSPLNDETRAGIFHCKGCDHPVYDAATKFKSGTGWPSFYQAIDGGIGTKNDRSFFMVRTECHCARCGSHLGHIFDDGPEPTGKRHCINGVSMTFRPAAA